MKRQIITGAAVLLMACSCSQQSSGSSHDSSQDLLGSWYSGEIGASFVFREDGRLYLETDLSDTMTFDEKGTAHFPGSDTDYSDSCSYDGSKLSFMVEDSVYMVIMERRGDPDQDSAYGSYDLIGGMVYDSFVEQFGDAGSRFGIIVGEEELTAEIDMCGYTVDGNEVTLAEKDLSIFGQSGGGDSVFTFAADGDVLTMMRNGTSIVFSRVE